MKNFSAEFIAKKSVNYYESLSKDVIREVQAEINGAAERGHFRVNLSDDLMRRAQDLGTDVLSLVLPDDIPTETVKDFNDMVRHYRLKLEY